MQSGANHVPDSTTWPWLANDRIADAIRSARPGKPIASMISMLLHDVVARSAAALSMNADWWLLGQIAQILITMRLSFLRKADLVTSGLDGLAIDSRNIAPVRGCRSGHRSMYRRRLNHGLID
jgi:hypothetical protein